MTRLFFTQPILLTGSRKGDLLVVSYSTDGSGPFDVNTADSIPEVDYAAAKHYPFIPKFTRLPAISMTIDKALAYVEALRRS